MRYRQHETKHSYYLFFLFASRLVIFSMKITSRQFEIPLCQEHCFARLVTRAQRFTSKSGQPQVSKKRGGSFRNLVRLLLAHCYRYALRRWSKKCYTRSQDDRKSTRVKVVTSKSNLSKTIQVWFGRAAALPVTGRDVAEEVKICRSSVEGSGSPHTQCLGIKLFWVLRNWNSASGTVLFLAGQIVDKGVPKLFQRHQKQQKPAQEQWRGSTQKLPLAITNGSLISLDLGH